MSGFSQCPGTGCTWNITGPDPGSYTINAGQKLCLNPGANFSGTITMNGGILVNCSSVSQTFTMNYNSVAGQSIVENYGDIYLSSSGAMSDVKIDNHGIFGVNGSKTMNTGTQINNYGNFNFTGSLTLGGSSSVTLNNYSIFTSGNTITIHSPAQLNNYVNGTITTVNYTSHSTWYNQGTITITNNFKNQSGSSGTIDGGCFNITSQFTNNASINGIYCGTITITGSSTNSSTGSITGLVAIVDNPAFPFVDSNSGTIDPTVVGVSCGCPGPDPCVIPDPLIWLKADAGWSAGTWSDQSPNGRNGTNVGDPTKINDCLNFNPAIEYDGNDETYSSAPELIFMSGNHHLNVFCVYEPSVAGTNLGVFGNQGNGGSNNIMLYKGIIGDGAGPLPDYPVPNMYGISPHLLSYTVDEEDNVTEAANSTTAYNNGILETSFTFNENNSGQIGNEMYVGSSGVHTNKQFFTGKISEFILYEKSDGNLSMSETVRTQVQSYLAIKYGFTLPLDYMDSQGNLIKSVKDPFNEGIACIGRDDVFELNQLKSRSKGDNINLIIAGNEFSDRQFISIAHDNQTERSTVDLFTDEKAFHCTERSWKIESKSGKNQINLELESDRIFEHVLVSNDPNFNDFEILNLSDRSVQINIQHTIFIKLADSLDLVQISRL